MFLIKTETGWVFMRDSDNVLYSTDLKELFTFMSMMHRIKLNDIEEAVLTLETSEDNVAEFGMKGRLVLTKYVPIPEDLFKIDSLR